MSSSETTRAPGAVPEFAPLAGPRVSGTIRGASVFPDFDARQPAGGDAPTPGGAALSREPSAVDTAREQGYAAGFAAGRDAAGAEYANGAAAFAGGVEELARFRAALLERYQRELLELALGVARKVVHRELADH